MKIAVVLLTWKRYNNLKNTLDKLYKQSYRDFDVYVSNGNLEEVAKSTVEKCVNLYKRKGLSVYLSHDGNELFTFRRFVVGKMLAEKGYEVIMYLDDDVFFSPKYIERSIAQYEPKAYISGYAWCFYRKGSSYYKHRTRVWDNETKIHYCGTGYSMIDASIFLEEGLFNPPEGGYKIEDLWLSYYTQHVMGWKLKYMEAKDIVLKGSEGFALFREVGKSEINKAVFLRKLVNLGWEIPD